MLIVLYDGGCPFCVRCRDFLDSSRHRVPLRLLDLGSSRARADFGRVIEQTDELVVIDSESGMFWVGPNAFVMCLWALEGWVWLARALLSTPLVFLVPSFFGWVSSHREVLGRLSGAKPCEGSCSAPRAYR